MSNSPSPERRPPGLRDDELIAIIVAFLSLGGIFFWVLGQDRQGFSLGGLFEPVPVTTPTPTATVGIRPTPVPPGQTPVPTPVLPGQDRGAIANTQPQTIFPAYPRPTVTPTLPPGTSVVPVPVPVPGGTVEGESPTPTPIPVSPSPTIAPTSPSAVRPPIEFEDVPDTFWAKPYIATLSSLGIISGLPDGSFQPNRSVTRTEFAVQLEKAFQAEERRSSRQFTDVASDFWGIVAIDKAVKTGFMSGYPNGTFRPTGDVSRVEVLSALVYGLNLPAPENPEAVLNIYQDRDAIPTWARERIAAATQAGLVTSHPNVNVLNPTQAATRGDVASMIYQALVRTGKQPAVPSQYTVTSP
ncbi:S-layer homology domain-containing protein [Pantanalinema rosaneae CENA516]|uniref:S-layer homology domain-containing protein n=1 Tax=Pantanalinema rosaneae TaxID=1620701 RepID=UPI003D6EAC60